MNSFGEYLKTLRDAKSVRLEEIASITKIHLHSLQMMEEDRWDELPPEPFIRGFIIAYAKYVGADLSLVLNKYKEYVKKEAPETMSQSSSEASPVKEFESTLPAEMIQNMDRVPGRRILVFGFLSLVFLIVGGVIYIGRQSEQKETTPVAVEQVPAAPVATQPVAPAVAEEKAAEPRNTASNAQPQTPPAVVEPEKKVSEFKHQLKVAGKSKSWMKVVIDDEKPVISVLKPNTDHEFSAKSKIKLVLGYAEGNEVSYNGKKVDGKQYQGTIYYFIYPAGSRFPQDQVKKAEVAPTTTSPEVPKTDAEASSTDAKN
jgi:cytoskeletal protein RodZ